MTSIALRLGPLKAAGLIIRRSPLHWLCEDGHLCRAGEAVAFCTVTLEPAPGQRGGSLPMSDEQDFQIAFAPRQVGRLRIDAAGSPGGYLAVHGLHNWNPDDVIARLELPSGDAPVEPQSDMRLLMLAGRRMSALADVDAGLLPGWHSRSRAWWGDDEGPQATLACIGICDAAGVVRGNQIPFVEAFEATALPAQLVYIPDYPMVPSALFLREQLQRTRAQNQAIAQNIGAALGSSRVPPTPDDLLFAGALLSWLEHSPLRDTYDVLSPAGLRRLGPPNGVLLSLSAEVHSVFRHKKLGYSLQMFRHRQAAAGPAIRAWLASEFEVVTRTLDDIRADYRQLVEILAAQTGAHVMILNRMSTSGYEDIVSYAPFDAPLGNTLESIAAQEMNLMLDDLARECDVSIIDVDALAAELGGAEHLPDGIHHSAAMQGALRSEIFAAWNLAGSAGPDKITSRDLELHGQV